MVHIKDKLAESIREKKTVFSFEYYPPKTESVRPPHPTFPPPRSPAQDEY